MFNHAFVSCSPPDRLDSFIINTNGVYYTSPIEWAASAIEMSIVSGKNAALMAFNDWYDITENINPGLKSGDTKVEL